MAALIMLKALPQSVPNVLIAALLVYVIYTLVVSIYLIWFSPLSHIPGPRLAAATRWYEFYYDALKVGKYYLKIERMHSVYGMIRPGSILRTNG